MYAFPHTKASHMYNIQSLQCNKFIEISEN